MALWDKLLSFGKKEKPKAQFTIKSHDKELVIWQLQELEPSLDERIEEFWIETVGVSDDGYWVLVGRRHGIVQLYDWKGRLHKLPSRPPAQVISDVVFNKRFLGLLTPPYLAVYFMEDPRKPDTWRSFKLSQEGIRPSVGLDIKDGILAFGVVGERIYTIDLSSDLTLQTVDFKSTFTYKDASIGELKSLKILNNSKIFLSGTKGCAIYSLSGNLINLLPIGAMKAVCLRGDKLYLGDGKQLVIYDHNLGTNLQNIETPISISYVDVDNSESFAFIADAESNRMGIVDLKSFKFLETIEGFGNSIVRISPDGTIYTSYYVENQDVKLYYFVKFNSNLIDFWYPKDRRNQILRNAKEIYKNLLRSLKASKDPQSLQNIPEYQNLLSMDLPIRELREVIEEAYTALENRRLEIFIESIRKKIDQGNVTKEDLKELENKLISKPIKELENLRMDLIRFFEKSLEEKLSHLESALSNTQILSFQEAESLPEVRSLREFIASLPKEMQQRAQETFIKILSGRLIKRRFERFKITLEKDKVYFGEVDFPKFSGERKKLKWRIRTEDRTIVNNKEYVRLGFEREDGIIIEPKRYPSILSIQDLKHTPQWLKRYLKHLNNLYPYQVYKMPAVVSYEETPWFVQNLEKFASLVKEQIVYNDGIVILEGDAGVGKNFLVEVFATLTNRPLYTIPCNSKMEKEDLTFVYEFDPKRGTRKVYSDLVKALKTPGAIVYFDEINTLPASLVKMFNPLFDYRRYLVLSSGEVIKAEKDVIFVGGMNPQNYLGVSELPQDIKSRSDILFIDYPPFEDEGNIYHIDEALILRDYITPLSILSKEEFVYIWHYLINNIPLDIPSNLLTEDVKHYVHLLFELISIANAVRKAYRAYQMQQSEEPVEFVFSIRDTVRCARRLQKYKNSKSVVLDTILPKVSSPLEKEIIKSIVERV